MVNTFIPYADFKKTAECLDYRRLGKQRCEAHMIIQLLENPTESRWSGWRNHPAVRMWRGYTDALKMYFNTIVEEWVEREYVNNYPLYEIPDEVEMPWWMGEADVHSSHQASLLRKAPEFYAGKFEVGEEHRSKGYMWPWIRRHTVFQDGKFRLIQTRVLEFSPVSLPRKKPNRTEERLG